jgi:hypothetical protein|tara:strand:- start:1732 stop:1950 length:219 start_codon:yes stop_codon:yes gene_type:complete
MNNKDLKQLVINYQTTFKSEGGEKVLKDLENRCGFNVTTHIKGDSHESAFLEGQRSVVLFIKNMLNKTPEEK